jgi:hypothetical protein
VNDPKSPQPGSGFGFFRELAENEERSDAAGVIQVTLPGATSRRPADPVALEKPANLLLRFAWEDEADAVVGGILDQAAEAVVFVEVLTVRERSRILEAKISRAESWRRRSEERRPDTAYR